MIYKIEKMGKFRIIGFSKDITHEKAYEECPAFWAEFREKFMFPIMDKGCPENALERAIMNNGVGEYGVSICNGNGFRYIIGGEYAGGDVPEEMTLTEIPEMLWAKFTGTGKMPHALQALNRRIYEEWLPNNGRYEQAEADINIEWYSAGKINEDSYLFGVWVPVKRKN